MGPAHVAEFASQLAQTVEDYLALHPAAAVLEEGKVLFDMRMAKYAISDAHGRCVLQMWSEERNIVRTVVEVQPRAQYLRLITRKMGADKPQTLEIVPSNDRRTPTARNAARKTYQRILERVLARNFPMAKVDGMRSAMDLEHSFGPAYVRGRLLQGARAEAVVGVGASEWGATCDGALTIGLLWLELCRQKSDGRRHFEGLKVIVPAGAWRTTAERMARLNHAAAGFELFTLDERTEELERVEFRDTGNFESRLVRAFNPLAALERCQRGIERMMGLVPEGARERVEVRARSSAEAVLALHGLEFARVRQGTGAGSFDRAEDVTFGAGMNETPLTSETEDLCRELLQRLFASRYPDGLRGDALFRMQSERWLESSVRQNIGVLFPTMREDLLYSQVPAMSAGDRGMLDLLSIDRKGRLAVLELKADEDLHLPLQALDYWIRVQALNGDRQAAGGGARPLCAFERLGYFPGAEVSPLPPRLLLVAPALRIHPANQQVLQYFAPEIEWEFVAVGEDWRQELKVVFRKRGGSGAGVAAS